MKIIHYPNLQTVIMVEKILKKEKDITRTELKKKLPKKVMHQTLNVIIKYLEDSGKIIDHHRHILWTYCPPAEMARIRRNTTPFISEDFRIPVHNTSKIRHRPSKREASEHRQVRRSKATTLHHQGKRNKKQALRYALKIHWRKNFSPRK